jgi:hypothetical protein
MVDALSFNFTLFNLENWFDVKSQHQKTEKIYNDIRFQLKMKHPQHFDEIFDFLQSQEVVEGSKIIDQLYSEPEKVPIFIDEQIDYYQNYLPGHFHKQVRKFYPKISKAAADDIFALIKLLNKGNTLKVYDLVATKETFDLNFYTIAENNFNYIHMRDLMYKYTEDILRNKFGNNIKVLYDEFKAQNPQPDIKLLLNQQKLLEIVDTFLIKRDALAYQNYLLKLNLCFPENKIINHHFLEFLMDIETVSGRTFDDLPQSHMEFLSDDNVFLRRYFNERQEEFKRILKI